MKTEEEKLKLIDELTSDEESLWHEESDQRILRYNNKLIAEFMGLSYCFLAMV